TLPATVTALADFAHIPPGGTELVHHIDEVEIPIADPRRCQHQDTICAECARYLFRGPGTGPTVARPGMTSCPCLFHDPGGGGAGAWWRRRTADGDRAAGRSLRNVGAGR